MLDTGMRRGRSASALVLLAFAVAACAPGAGDPTGPAGPEQARIPALQSEGGHGPGSDPESGDEIHPTDVLVAFDGALPPPAVFVQMGAALLESYAAIATAKVRSLGGLDSEVFSAFLLRQPGVIAAEPDRRIAAPEPRSMSVAFNDGSRTHADFVDQAFVTRMNVAAAHAVANGWGVRVAVIDTGIDPDHPELVECYDGGRDFVGRDLDPREEANGLDDDGDGLVDEAHGHGTHVAALVGLLAPESRVRAYRVLDAEGAGWASDVVAALLFSVLDGADVVNLSLGMMSPFRALEVALEYTVASGVLVFASVGNDASGTVPQYPAAYAEAHGVGSVDAADVFSTFSNWGPSLYVTAPGEAILSAAPGGGYAVWTGTSMSTPMAAALGAVLLSAQPAPSPMLAAAVIASTAAPVAGVPGGATVGRVDFLAAVQALPGAPARGAVAVPSPH